MRLTTAQRTRPYPGFSSSGDLVVVRQTPSCTMLAVIDVLGHGPDAAEVAVRAGEYLNGADLDADAEAWMQGLHDALARTRGAAAGLGRAESGALQVTIVGNIEVRCSGTRVGVIPTPGIVGRRMRRLRSFSFPMHDGDRLAMHSDGLRRLDLVGTRQLSLEGACDHLMHEFAVAIDDASLLLTDFHDA
ncbi:MAG: serine/threonine-protein phosphatase [Nannocystaceae bacterium]|nr:serine/threonine-protein phosphatase [Nannocystaceae bacterium]